MPLQATSGAASYDAFGGGVPVVPNYIEDVFSTWLYTGNGSTQTIINDIDLSTKGGLVWIKPRNNPYGATNHFLRDTVRGGLNVLFSNTTAASNTLSSGLTFNSNGFTTNSTNDDNYGNIVSWIFREQPKFFNVVTYTGNGVAGTTIAHNLGSVPGCIMVKSLGAPVNGGADGFWFTYHRGLTTPQSGAVFLNNTDGRNGTGAWNNTLPTSTVFTVDDGSYTNINGRQYVAYLFAHDAGGFGLTGTDNVISCGSASTDSGGNWTATLGYEPQWILWKSVGSGQWEMHDTMRGANLSETRRLFANLSNAEGDSGGPYVYPTATGFVAVNGPGPANSSIIYIAIRRGPMKVPTDATKVFALGANGLGAAGGNLGNLSASDLAVNTQRAISGSTASSPNFVFMDRLRGVGQANTGNTTQALYSSSTAAETSVPSTASSGTAAGTNGAYLFSESGFNSAIRNVCQGDGGNVGYAFRRAPGFFDEVCYTGTGSATTVAHNLTVVPELMIVKNRGTGTNWAVYTSALGATQTLFLNTTATPSTITSAWNDTAPTSSVFTVGSAAATNTSGNTYVNYLFATCPGVSKVGSYTGNGTTQTINCGFTGGARFVLIKRTDAAGDWYVYDTARGMTTLTDPYLLLNSTAAESATLGSVTTVSTGFAVNASILSAINTNAASYIFLAIA